MKYFFADSQDFVDPDFDFVTEERSPGVRQRRDVYAHELFDRPPYDGVLISKAIVDGNGSTGGKYSIAQRNRLLNAGAREFLRLDSHPTTKQLVTMGDCGAFSYMREDVPPFSVKQVADFYSECGFDWGVSVDHVIPAYDTSLDETLSLPGFATDLSVWQNRQAITLELANDFLADHRRNKRGFLPLGVAQGWSPKSYASAVTALQKMGYKKIAIGGLVPLKTIEMLAVVEEVGRVRRPTTDFHLLGVMRLDHAQSLKQWGVTSFDSTSPLRQAFMDDRDNYYSGRDTYVAVRVPQVDGNPRLKAQILAGAVDGRHARVLERTALKSLRAYDQGKAPMKDALDAVVEYGHLYNQDDDRREDYAAVLADRPWKSCKCGVCKSIGIDVILFRGAERNRRRGFHNLFVFYHNLQRETKRRGRVQA